MKTYQKIDMYLEDYRVGTHPLFERSRIIEEKIITNTDGIDFEYETDDDTEQLILNEGKRFLATGEVGESFRWEVDPLSLQYCELRRIE
jgi:hypothetical protein